MNSSNLLTIELSGGQAAFEPGQTVSATASWQVDHAKSAEVRLFWFTSGSGTQDVRIIESQPISNPPPAGRMSFSFQLPDQPYSFSGRLIVLKWAIELVIEPGELAARSDFVVGPTGTEILLGTAPFDF